MMRAGSVGLAAIITIMTISGCAPEPEPEPGAADMQEPTWLEASDEAPDRVVARQLRGLDVAMIEIDHRYAELYFAVRDGNWGYAAHQVEHMAVAMDLALERRPDRAASARGHFYPALSRLESAIAEEDREAADAAMAGFQRACNSCHEAEGEPDLVVGTPSQRRTTIGAS